MALPRWNTPNQRLRAWVLRGFFRLFKATMWRLVEYNKGAVAAIALFVTIALSILKLVLPLLAGN